MLEPLACMMGTSIAAETKPKVTEIALYVALFLWVRTLLMIMILVIIINMLMHI
jgi:hypothetical protein